MNRKNIIYAVLFTLIVGATVYGWVILRSRLGDQHKPPMVTLLNEMEKTPAPGFSFKDLKGNSRTLAEFKGKIIIVNFWASWCDPCIKEIPSMVRLVNRYKGDLVVLAISLDYTMEELEVFLKAFEIDSKDFVVTWDKDKSISEMYQLQALPESFILDRDFTLIRKVAGAEDWDSVHAISFFDKLFK